MIKCLVAILDWQDRGEHGVSTKSVLMSSKVVGRLKTLCRGGGQERKRILSPLHWFIILLLTPCFP